MIIRTAIPQDFPSLNNLTSCNKSPGKAWIEKCPSYDLLPTDPDRNIALVATTMQGEPVASLAATKADFVFRGQKQSAHILGDIKFHPAFEKSPLLFRLIKKMINKLQGAGAGLVIYERFGEMESADSLSPLDIENMLSFEKITLHSAYLLPAKQLPFKVQVPLAVVGYDEQPLRIFYDHYYHSDTLHPVVEQLQDATHFTCTQDQNIKAAISIWEDEPGVQKTRIHFPEKSSWPVLRSIRKLVGVAADKDYTRLPRVMHVKYFGYEANHESTLMSLLDHASHFAWENKYQYLYISTDDEKVLLNKLIRSVSDYRFHSAIMTAGLANFFHAKSPRAVMPEL